jgi:predicted nucleotidyltransferase
VRSESASIPKIILFGSHAYGKPHADSDVDILVIMPARNQLDQAVKIELECDPPFPLDIIVRTPKKVAWGLEQGDSFLQEIVSRGKTLYEAHDTGMGAKAESDFRAARKLYRGKEPFHDQSCFLCQQCAEKYLKALLVEIGATIPYTHILKTCLLCCSATTLL